MSLMLLIGCREQHRYTLSGLITERVYLYRDNSIYYEVKEGVIQTFNHPRPFNLTPTTKLMVDDISIVPEVEFIPNVRYKERPVVHLVYGGSGLGKSTLFMDYPRVYETDSSIKLEEDCLYSSVIIIGNRSKFTPQDVISFFDEHELHPEFILVKFSSVLE